ncbi:MAG: hypothetical protein MK116_00440 [Phycisphaerales bacterium]|nr:hypothetical protein [Phycisphaerales bacterium]
MILATVSLAVSCLLGTDRYAIVELEAHPDFPRVSISSVSDDLRVSGSLFNTSTGPTRAATWRAGELVLDVSTYSSSRGMSLGENDALWGDAEHGGGSRAFRINFEGTITDHWVVPSTPAWTSFVGGIDGQAVVRNSGGHGSSVWTGRHCREDGSVVTIEGGDGSLFPEVVGRLSDGSPVACGIMEVAQQYHAFLWYFNDGLPAIDIHDTLGAVNSSSLLGLTTDGVIYAATAKSLSEWTVATYDPISGEVVNGPAVSWLNETTFNIETGQLAGIGRDFQADAMFSVWRGMPGGEPEILILPEEVQLATAEIDSSGAVILMTLELPNYDSKMYLWPAGTSEIVPLEDRVFGSYLDVASSFGPMSPGGHMAVSTLGGSDVMAVKLSPGDANGDGDVGVDDLLLILESWGPWTGSCGPDLDFDGTVDVDDVLLLLSEWSS